VDGRKEKDGRKENTESQHKNRQEVLTGTDMIFYYY
jgi:hypothetical protein